MNTQKNITVIGATGNLGAPVVKFLLDFGFTVKIIVRNREKAMRIFGSHPGLVTEVADLQDVPALTAALKGTEYLYLNLATEALETSIPFAPDREGLANILKAADRASIRQIITISGLGALDNVQEQGEKGFAPNIIRKQGQRMLKEAGIPYTILHCTWFADSFVLFRRNGVYSVIGDTKNPVWFTNCYDLTRLIVNSHGNTAAMNREFPVQGNKGIPHPEAARTFLSAWDGQSKVSPLPLGIIRLMALFNPSMKFLRYMAEYFRESREEFIAGEYGTYAILGEPLSDLGSYAALLKEKKIYDYLENR
ncbi:MAG: SDR family oxidoreductase [Bacteroidota bacterium]